MNGTFKFWANVSVALALVTTVLPVQADGWPATSPGDTVAPGQPTTGLFIVHGETNAPASGDWISSVNGGSGTYYSYFVEVPPTTTNLIVEIFDPDVRGAPQVLPTAGSEGAFNTFPFYDQLRSNGTETNYALLDPLGTEISAFTGSSTAPTPMATAHGNWFAFTVMAPSTALTSPSNGHWEVRVNSLAGTNVSGYGIRARATVGGVSTQLRVYADAHLSVQTYGPNGTASTLYVAHPYVTGHCQVRIRDHDADAGGIGAPSTITLQSALPTLLDTSFTGAALSNQGVWATNQTAVSWNTDVAAARPGIFTAEIVPRATSGTTNEFQVGFFNPNAPAGAPTVPDVGESWANSWRTYLPTPTSPATARGTAPVKPYLTQRVFHANDGSANPPGIAQTGNYDVVIKMINPTAYPITFSAANLVRSQVPGVTVLLAAAPAVNSGSVVAIPGGGGSAAIEWNPGTVAAGVTVTMNYRVSVTPTALGKIIITGTPASLGTSATYLDETANATQTRATYNWGPLCELAVTAGGAAVTVPVTLSNVEVQESGSDLVVNFNTATEAGTLGFRVLADIGKGLQARVEIGSVASKTIDSLKEQSYSVRARNPGADQIWIEESSVDGKSELYGPYKVGSSVGEVGLAAPLNWAAINAEQTSFRAARATLLRGTNAQAAELRVSKDSWVRVTHEQLVAAGVDLSGQASNNIAVRLGNDTVPTRVSLGAKSFGAGSAIEFFAKAVKNSLYTTTSVYRIEIGRSLGLAEIDARSTGSSVGPEVLSVADTRVLDKNSGYSFSSPLEDPWFNFRALRSGGNPVGVGSISFTLDDRVELIDRSLNNVPETLEVSFWGGLDYSGPGPDHHAMFKLNGVLLGETRFDGFAARIERFTIPAGSLITGKNVFTVELPTGTGFAADIVNVESVTVGYGRKLIPQTDRFSVELPATPAANASRASDAANQINASTFVIRGLSGAPIVAVLERGGVQSVLKTDAIAAGSLRIELAAQAGDRLSLMPVNNSVLPNAATPLEDPIAGGKSSYLIISHPSFIANLTPLILAKQQQGFTVKVVDVEAIYRYYSAGVVDPAAIQLAIRRAQQSLSTTHVLLVGGDTYDYQNVLGVNSVSFIPTNYRRTGPIIAFAPSDAVYADTDSDGVANVAIGRWPVRTNAELNALLGKTLSYQNTRKALFVSDRSLNGVSFANQTAPLANLLGQDWTTSQLSLDSYAAGQAATARADIVSNLEGGTSLLSYYGHSAPASWSREGLITASQVSGGLFNTVNQPFAAVQLGCWGTYFVEPTSTTVAHQMLLMPKGAAAVLGATSLTESNSDIALANYLLPRLTTTSLGEALLQAQQGVATELPDAKDVILGGTLLGDPALK